MSSPALSIATAPRAASSRWGQSTTTWGAYCQRIQGEPATDKDCGGYVFGRLADGTRSKDTVIDRCVLVLDMDKATTNGPALRDTLDMVHGWAAALHTTWRHTPAAPRYRLAVPLSRSVTPDEYRRVALNTMRRLGIEQFDLGAAQAERFMFWPATQHPEHHGAWIVEGDPLDVDALLAEHTDEDAQLADETLDVPVGTGAPNPAWCAAMLGNLEFEVTVAPEGQRNDTLNRAAWRLGRYVAGGHLDEGKVREVLTGAALAAGLDPDEVAATLDSGLDSGKREPRDPPARVQYSRAALFGSTPVLGQVLQAAQARLVSPEALLGCVLARVVADTPPAVVLPPIVGAAASLNLAVALVGESGGGKSVTVAVSRELLLGLREPVAAPIGLGSGEGLIDSFMESAPDPTNPRKTIRQLSSTPQSLLDIDEIGRLDAVQGRSGSSIAAVLRSALTGGDLSTANADSTRKRTVPAMSYRLAVLAGVQPDLSGVLLDDVAAGTPQRWLWMLTHDPGAPDTPPAWPGPLDWEPPVLARPVLPVAEPIQQKLREARLRQLRTGEAGTEGHRNLTRLKVGAALALLHGEAAVTDRWWHLAGLVMAASDQAKSVCLSALARVRQHRAEAQGRSDYLRTRAADQARAADESGRVEQAARAVWRLVHGHASDPERRNNRRHAQDEGCTPRCLNFALRRYLPKNDTFNEAARDHADGAGWITERNGRWFPGASAPAEEMDQ